ncbi:hypothetical protein IKF63_02315 [Candidatus Saccharibacteria bacterium]|nr:hypothetical protein [Candidatus Saccharibacteria bacterium]
MMTGILYWNSGNLGSRGTFGYFWASTPNSYTDSRSLYFLSTNVYPKRNNAKPHGFTLRCVARKNDVETLQKTVILILWQRRKKSI